MVVKLSKASPKVEHPRSTSEGETVTYGTRVIPGHFSSAPEVWIFNLEEHQPSRPMIKQRRGSGKKPSKSVKTNSQNKIKINGSYLVNDDKRPHQLGWEATSNIKKKTIRRL